MRQFGWLTLGAVLGLSCAAAPALLRPTHPSPPATGESPSPTDPAGAALLVVTGRTQPIPGRAAAIAPVVLHPVEEVRVVAGDRVKKGQVLIKLDDDEPRADVRAKEAALAEVRAGLARLKAQPREQERAEARALLEGARVAAKEARETLKHLERLFRSGHTSEAAFRAARAALLKAEADERAAVARLEQLLRRPIALEVAELEAKVASARAALETARAELEHYTLTAPLDGVVSWLSVTPGTVSRPGTAVWGEVLDLSEVDVRCELTPKQADRVSVGQAAAVRRPCAAGGPWAARVAFVGITADVRSGRVPVLVRLGNAEPRLRRGIEVRVRFPAATGPLPPPARAARQPEKTAPTMILFPDPDLLGFRD
jgi:HlyD family secretion protein